MRNFFIKILVIVIITNLGFTSVSYAGEKVDCYKEKIDKRFILYDDKIYEDFKINDEKEAKKAYYKVSKEENYILNLINSRGEKTSLNNWKFNLNYLEENYDSIKNSRGVNMEYIDSYIHAYKIVIINECMPCEKTDEGRATRSDKYNANDAVYYAIKHYNAKNYNSEYPDWSDYGGDCANFVSQCIHAGGKEMQGSVATNFSDWFSYGNSINIKNVSSTWRGADAFRNYWQNNAIAYKKFSKVDEDSWNYGRKGDVVSLMNENGRTYHTMIIIHYDYPDFIMAAHTLDTKNARLKSYFPNKFIIYKM